MKRVHSRKEIDGNKDAAAKFNRERHMMELISHFEGDPNRIGGYCLALLHTVLTSAFKGDELRAANVIARMGETWAATIRSTLN